MLRFQAFHAVRDDASAPGGRPRGDVGDDGLERLLRRVTGVAAADEVGADQVGAEAGHVQRRRIADPGRARHSRNQYDRTSGQRHPPIFESGGCRGSDQGPRTIVQAPKADPGWSVVAVRPPAGPAPAMPPSVAMELIRPLPEPLSTDCTVWPAGAAHAVIAEDLPDQTETTTSPLEGTVVVGVVYAEAVLIEALPA